MLRGVVEAQKNIHIFVNVKEENLQKLLTQLPALKRPTISPLSEKGWFAVNTVIGRGDLLKMLPTLRKLAQGLVGTRASTDPLPGRVCRRAGERDE